jgi:hypothetical protein
VESGPTLFAVVNGGADNIVNLDYFDTIAYANLWEGKCHRLRGLGHAPFWQGPRSFNPIFGRFLRDVEVRHGLQIRSDLSARGLNATKRRSNGPSATMSASAMAEVESSLCASVSSTKVKPEASWRICDSGWDLFTMFDAIGQDARYDSDKARFRRLDHVVSEVGARA